MDGRRWVEDELDMLEEEEDGALRALACEIDALLTMSCMVPAAEGTVREGGTRECILSPTLEDRADFAVCTCAHACICAHLLCSTAADL